MSQGSGALYIPMPSGYFGRRRGVFSTRHATAQRVIVRFAKEHRDIVKKGAKLTDMKEAEFIREIALAAAKSIIARAVERANEDVGISSG